MDSGHNCEAHIERLRGEMMAEVATLKGQVGAALTGVADFHQFVERDFPALKSSVESFHLESRTREDMKAKEQVKHDAKMKWRLAVAGVLVTLIIGGGTIAEMRHEDQSRADMQQALQRAIHESLHQELGATK